MPDPPPRPPKGTYWLPVRGGLVLAGPHPVLADEGLDDRVKHLIEEVGGRHFVDLSSKHDWMPGYQHLLPHAVKYTRYEIIDRRLPTDPAALKELLHEVMTEAAGGRISYFHCQAGLGRTGTVMAVMLREAGLGGQQALDDLVRLRIEARLHEGSPEFEEQREYVRSWVV